MQPWYLHQLSQGELGIFVEEAKTGRNNNTAFVGTIDSAAARRIETICGKKIGKIMLESGAIRHSFKKSRHNLRDDDLMHMVNAVNTATDIRLSDTSHQNNLCLEICKDIDGRITFVMEARVHYGGWLALVTCYRTKK